jgi:hypothetical protein
MLDLMRSRLDCSQQGDLSSAPLIAQENDDLLPRLKAGLRASCGAKVRRVMTLTRGCDARP